MPETRIIMCVDLDAFFASVEELLHPEWRGLPLLVGGRPDERGVVASCSYAARKFGIRSAMPMGRALKLCPHAIVTPGRHAVYREHSRRVMAILHDYGCVVEQVSVDEVFIEATDSAPSWGGAPLLAADMKQRIRAEVGLTSTIGIASNKLVAKIASNQGKPDGLLAVPPGKEAAFLAPLPIDKLWGVGPKGAAQLAKLGIHTIAALQVAPLGRLQAEFGQWAHDMQRKAQGIDSSLLSTDHEPRSISRETTFTRDLANLDELKKVLLSLTEEMAHDLRAEGVQAGTIAIKLRWASFETITRQTSLREPTDSATLIYKSAAALLTHAMVNGGKVRLLGVRGTRLTGGRQLSMFDEGSEKRVRLNQAVDDIREKFGDSALRRATLVPKEKPKARK